MSDIKQGQSMPIPGQATEAASAAPKTSPKASKPRGKSEAPAASEEKASMAPSTKGQKNVYGGQWRGDHPSSDPKPMACPFDSSKSELDGHSLKKPKK